MRTVRLLTICLLISLLIYSGPALGQSGKTHKLVATPQTVHTGFFDSTIPPVLTIESGDTVVLNTLMLMDNQLRCGMTFEELVAVHPIIRDFRRRLDRENRCRPQGRLP